jgi:LacI family transcriptional regulator
MTKHSPTLNEVATAAGVSLMTASRAINNRSGVSGKTREHVLSIAAGLGYVANRAAQKLSGGRSYVIGVIAADLGNPFISAVVTGAGQAAWDAGYETLVYSQLAQEKRPSVNVMPWLRQIADGVIAVLPLEYGYLEELASIHIPVITIDHRGKHSHFPSIASDSYEGACMAVRHLAELGHRRIAHLTGDERLASAIDRHRGYVDTRSQLGLERDDALIVAGDFTQKRGFDATCALLALDRPPTAIFAGNDLSAIGAIGAIREAGLRVPEDISVVGFDDIPAAAQIYPPLTTIRQPMHQMGRSAVNTLLAQIAGIAPASPQVWLPNELIVRATTAAPHA